MSVTQQDRVVSITTPLGENVLLFQSMKGSEQLGRLFEYQVDLLSENHNIALEDIVGQNVTINLSRGDLPTRHFNGFVSRFGYFGTKDNFAYYRATVSPWLWFLTRTSDCRIFQDMTVPDILKQVFGDLGFTDFDERLTGEYRTWEYCVQYRETAFNFVSRLMEQEGIYYYFKHQASKHILVLCDGVSAHSSVPDGSIPYFPPENTQRREHDHIFAWSLTQRHQPTKYELDDFNFKTPRADLKVKRVESQQFAYAQFELFDCPGEYTQVGEGQSYVNHRLEELYAQFEQVTGQGNATDLTTGVLFSLTGYPREDQNGEHIVIGATYQLESNAYSTSSGGGEGDDYHCSFTAIDNRKPFRTSRITPKPMVQGPQTAIVTGPSGEEIHTDEYGRVKVQFHWDRHGNSDESSSCWVRASQAWAGAGWGSMHIPHVGHEVIISFLDGDPDRPVITGRLYNGVNNPADSLPAEKNKSVIRSFGDNDIVIEDKEGDKCIHIKQACGNEIRMHESTPDIEIKQECGNEMLMKASGPDIEIKQACGNEILMHEAEGIQIRDKYGNEVVLDAAAGFMRLHSPSHSSTIELGKSILVDTKSKKTETITGACKVEIGGATEEVFIGVKASQQLAATSETFVGVKHSTLVGMEIKGNVAGVIEKNAADKIFKASRHFSNIIGTKKLEVGSYELDATTDVKVEGGTEIELKVGGSSIKISGSKIELNAQDIVLKGSSAIKLTTPLAHFTKGKIRHKDTDIS